MPKLSIAFQTDKSAAEYIALAQQVNQYDVDAVTVYADLPYHPSFGPLMLMAPHIERAPIGVSAIPVSRMHPVDIAANLALLADVAQAGVYIGVGRGAWLKDHGYIERRPPLAAVREAIDIIRLLLRGETGGYQGEAFQLAEHVRVGYPLPPEPDSIPVLVGTWGPKLSAIAGEIADEVKIGGSANADVVPVMQEYIAVGEERAGRAHGTAGVVVGAVCVCDHDRELARAAARRSVALYLPVVASLDPTVTVDPELVQKLQICANAGDWEGAAALISDEMLEKFAFAGNPDDIIRQTESLFAASASRVEFGTPHGLNSAEGLRLLGETVIPAVRSNWKP
jgi:5,10-methylenetetrahydromethanopterin reductase